MSRRPVTDRRIPSTMIAGYDSTVREYRVTFAQSEIAHAFVGLGLTIPAGALRDRAEAMAYYTTDKDDMIATAQQMDLASTPRALVGEVQWRLSSASKHVRAGRFATEGKLA